MCHDTCLLNNFENIAYSFLSTVTAVHTKVELSCSILSWFASDAVRQAGITPLVYLACFCIVLINHRVTDTYVCRNGNTCGNVLVRI